MRSSPMLSLSPTFPVSSSSAKLADIATVTVEELSVETESEADDELGFKTEVGSSARAQNESQEQEEANKTEDDDSEFSFVCRELDSSPISADEIFYNGQIRPVFPIFNRDLASGGDAKNGNSVQSEASNESPIRLPLRELLIEDRDPPSSSSSEAEDLPGMPHRTYCMRAPKPAVKVLPERCEKSSSTGSSKRWKFRDLLRRSNSEGKGTLVFVTPSKANARETSKAAGKAKAKANARETCKAAGKPRATAKRVTGAEGGPMSASNKARSNGAMKEEDRRRAFLPYRQDLVGFLANVNGLSRNLQPF